MESEGWGRGGREGWREEKGGGEGTGGRREREAERNNSHIYVFQHHKASRHITIVIRTIRSKRGDISTSACVYTALHPVNASHGVAFIWLRSYTYRLVGGVENISNCLLLGIVEWALVHVPQALLEGGREGGGEGRGREGEGGGGREGEGGGRYM